MSDLNNMAHFDKVIKEKLGIHKMEFIASGGFGSVYAGYKKAKGRAKPKPSFAVKVTQAKSLDPDVQKKWLNDSHKEIATLEELNCCPHIVKLFGHAWIKNQRNQEFPNYLVLKMELLDADLDQVLQGLQGPMEPSLVIRFGYQILQALDFMHKKQLVHHDIKTLNIMICGFTGKMSPENLKAQLPTCLAKIIDVGMCKKYDQSVGFAIESKFHGGTRIYNCPEKTPGQSYDPYKSDSYSVGMVLVELLLGMGWLKSKMKWNEKNEKKNCWNLSAKKSPKQGPLLSEVWSDYLRTLDVTGPFHCLFNVVSKLIAPQAERIYISEALELFRQMVEKS